jgi:AraC-like DNA-binding protein
MDRAAQIKDIIERNKNNEQFTVNCLANELGISYSYLYETVYKLFDMSPQQLIETIRMEEAVRLVAAGVKLIRIYKRIGYDNLRTFREAFHKRLNTNYSSCRSTLTQYSDPERNDAVDDYISHLWVIRDN